jgi:hypothetical protein
MTETALTRAESGLRAHPIMVFVAGTFLVQAGLGWLSTEGLVRRGWFEWSFLIKPAAALAMAYWLDGRQGVLGVARPLVRFQAHPGWYLFALTLLPAILLASVYLHRGLTGSLDTPVRFDWWAFQKPYPRMYFVIAAMSLADEIAYFGFVYTRLAPRITGLKASLWVAVCWSISYTPRIFMESEMMADSTIPLWLFILNFLTLTPICAWVYGSTKSGMLVSLSQITANFSLLVLPVMPKTAGTLAVFGIMCVLMGVVSWFLVYRYGARYLTVSGQAPALGS